MKQTLNKGDIIVFKAENDWLSKAIAWFTKSDVSHAAMAYSEDSIVEVGANGIGVHKVDISEGENVYVMRLSSHPDATPLINTANAYLDAKVRYDFPALFILAGLLIYRRIIPTNKLLRITNRIISACGLMLDEMIQHAILHHPDRAMVCSQLVYQIFYDCGGEYRIQIVNGSLQNSALQEDASIRLCDLLSESKTLAKEEADTDVMKSSLTPEETKELAKELYDALCETEPQNKENLIHLTVAETSQINSTLSAAEQFLSKLENFLHLIKCDMPLDAMFVTPGDLVYHAVNLKQEGTLSLERIKSFS